MGTRLAILAVAGATLAISPLHANLLSNGSFERDSNADGVADGWTLNVHAGAEGRAEISTDARHGWRSQLVIHENDSPEWVRVSVMRIPVTPKALCRVSCWVKAEGAWQILLYEFVADGSYLTHAIGSGGSSDWRQVAKAVQLSDGVRYLKLSLITTRQGRVWFDGARVDDLARPPRLRVPMLSASPEMDGALTDSAWDSAAVADSLLLLGGEGQTASASTRVHIGMVGGRLHVGWECEEPRLDEQRLDGPPGWNHDTVELFLIPPDSGVVYHVGVTPAGGKLEQVQQQSGGAQFYVDWYSRTRTGGDAEAEMVPYACAARRGEGAWSAEMMLDLSGEEALTSSRSWRLLLARSRKVATTEENSAWSLIAGDRFFVPERFGHVAFPVELAGTPERIGARSFLPPRSMRLVPEPKVISWSADAPLVLDVPVRIGFSGDQARAAADVLCRMLNTYLDLESVVTAGADNARIVIEQTPISGTSEGEPWQRAEAYTIDVEGERMTVRAAGERGLLYGAFTLRQLLSVDQNRAFLTRARIRDWPDLQWRGWHLIGPETRAVVDDAKQVLDIMAALKLNWVSFQIDNRMRYERDPDLSRSEAAPTKADLRGLAAHARSLGMEVIPMTQCWSHFSYFLNKEKYRHLAEIQNPPADARRKYWNYCPRHPETHDLVFGLIEEQLEAFPDVKYFHVGLYEITFEPVGQCPRCRDATGGELLAEEINRLHKFLQDRGLRMCMWGDQLLVEHNGKYFQTAEALPHVPRDVLIFDWHYGAARQYPSVEFFMGKGFDVIASGWYEPLNVLNFAAEAQRQGALGYGGTTWYAIQRIRDEVRLMTGMVLTGEASWNRGPVDPDTLSYLPAQVFRELWSSPRQADGFITVDLGSAPNIRLMDQPPRGGWMGLGPDHDLSSLPTGRQWFGGIPFDIQPPGGDQCIMLAAGNDAEETFPREVWHLPVGVRTAALAFLHTCSRPDTFSRHIYDRQGVNPGLVATYVVRYADGASEDIELHWNRQVTDWNSQLGSAHGETAWHGATAGGALIRLESFRWLNPHPEKTVEAIDIVSGGSKVRPVVLAITALAND